jgi:hypothetical protein
MRRDGARETRCLSAIVREPHGLSQAINTDV